MVVRVVDRNVFRDLLQADLAHSIEKARELARECIKFFMNTLAQQWRESEILHALPTQDKCFLGDRTRGTRLTEDERVSLRP